MSLSSNPFDKAFKTALGSSDDASDEFTNSPSKLTNALEDLMHDESILEITSADQPNKKAICRALLKKRVDPNTFKMIAKNNEKNNKHIYLKEYKISDSDESRKRNRDAAKKCREKKKKQMRKLEFENDKLKHELMMLKNELSEKCKRIDYFESIFKLQKID